MRTVLLSLVFIGCSTPDLIDSNVYIKGGVNVDPSDFVYKHTVAVGDQNRAYCSGTVIRQDLVLTAAHCLTDDVSAPFTSTDNMRIYYDSGKKAKVKVQAWHSKYDPEATVQTGMTPPPNDLALVKLVEDLPYPMLPAALADRPISAGVKATLAGYGTVDNRFGMDGKTLRKVDVKVTNVDTEKKRIDTNNPYANNRTGACAGDSGGSIFIGSKLYGALSIGTTLRGGGCGGWNSYTNIYEYIDKIAIWVSEIDAADNEFILLSE